MQVITLQKLLSTDELRTHERVQRALVEIGEDLGYRAVDEYEVLDLVPNRPRSFIDVVWFKGDKIAVAFEVRMKRIELDIPTSEKDRGKLARLKADEKFLVNASRITGATYVFKMGEDGDWLPKGL